MSNKKITYDWSFASHKFKKNKGKVFSCFSGGGGSTIGYKLADFDVIGNNEIDNKINKVYIKNHKPKINYNCDIRDMLKIDLHLDLYNLDILDGSPPCTPFSQNGLRKEIKKLDITKTIP